MQGAPLKAIQELAGHQDIKTTMRYMHLAPQTLLDAISLLDDRSSDSDEEVHSHGTNTASGRHRRKGETLTC